MAARRTGWMGRAVGLALCIAAAMASPAPVAADVPETVQRDIGDLIEDLSLLYSGADLAYADFTAEESGTGYRVTLHGVRLMARTGRHPELGAVVLVLEPEDDGYRITGIEMPRSFPLKSVNGGDAGQITVAEYALTGLWKRTARALVESELRLADLRLDSWPEEMTLEEAKAVTRLSPAGDGLWQETASVEISEFRHTRQGLSAYLSGGKLHLLCDVVDLDQYMALQRLLDEAEAQSLARDAVDPALLAELRQSGNSTRAFQLEMSVRDLLFDADGDEPVVVPNAELSMSAEGLDRDLARVILHVAAGGADVPVTDFHGGGLQYALGPQSMTLDLAMEDLPRPALWEAFVDIGYSANAADDSEATSRLGLALQDAGTRLRLLPSMISSKVASVSMDGELRADPSAALGFVASAVFDVANLSMVLGHSLGGPNGDAAEILDGLADLARPARQPDGTPVSRYEVELGGDGTLQVNGKPYPLFDGSEN